MKWDSGSSFEWCIHLQEGKVMRKLFVVALVILPLVMVGCASRPYFGVESKAIAVPEECGQTEAAIAKAEKSPGAQYCPEKIAQAKEMAKKGVETYWACRTKEAMKMLADARALAAEAEKCQAPPPPKPVAKPTPPPPPPPPRPTGTMCVLKGTNFAFDSAVLTPQGKEILNAHVEAFKMFPDLKVEIVGHTDSIGAEEYNQGLSERRAKAVADYLMSKGVSKNRIVKVYGLGETKPVASNSTKEGREMNRRVEICAIPTK